MQILGSNPDLWSQKLWLGLNSLYLASPPDDSGTHSGLRSSGLDNNQPWLLISQEETTIYHEPADRVMHAVVVPNNAYYASISNYQCLGNAEGYRLC